MPDEPRRYVVLISDEMQRLCFPGAMWEELLALHPFTTLRSAPGGEEWAQLCREMATLVSPWGVPVLPRVTNADDLPRYICYLCGGVKGFIAPEHFALGVRLTNWGDAISHTIAESALMGILACLRRVGLRHETTHTQRAWHTGGGAESASLFDQKVGLIGLGAIAQALVPLLRPFGVTIHAHDPYVCDGVFEQLGVTRSASLASLFRACPIISNHAGDVDELAGAIDAEMLSLLPDDGVFVNTARGRILVEEDLAAQHEAGRLWSCLDVFHPEPPPPDHPLRRTPRCLITPHQAGPTKDQYWRMGERALLNLGNWRDGKPLVGEVTAEMLPRMT
jgi:phosphoglycerate dehydrogenase-like enzyme